MRPPQNINNNSFSIKFSPVESKIHVTKENELILHLPSFGKKILKDMMRSHTIKISFAPNENKKENETKEIQQNITILLFDIEKRNSWCREHISNFKYVYGMETKFLKILSLKYQPIGSIDIGEILCKFETFESYLHNIEDTCKTYCQKCESQFLLNNNHPEKCCCKFCMFPSE